MNITIRAREKKTVSQKQETLSVNQIPFFLLATTSFGRKFAPLRSEYAMRGGLKQFKGQS